MSTINTNIPSLVAARVLSTNQSVLSRTLERLSTGYRINRGEDDPAGLIASETLRAEKASILASIDNANRAKNVMGVAEGALTEVSSLLIQLEDLVDKSASTSGLSADELKANQLKVDSILDTINRISSTTTFAGRKLIDGTMAYNLSSVSTSAIADVSVNAARLADNATRAVTVQVTASAETARLTYSGGTVGSAGVSISVGGNKGIDTFTFASGTTTTNIAASINAVKELTGVSATATSTSAVVFSSTRYGSEQYVTVEALTGTFDVAGGTSSTKDYGEDPTVLVNGQAADTAGLDVSFRSATLDVDFTMTSDYGGQTAGGTKSFYVTGGGARFRITPDLSLAGQVDVGINSMAVTSLGNQTVGRLSSLRTGQGNSLSSGNFQDAQEIVRTAARQVASVRGRLGSIQQNTLSSTINSLQVTYENVSAAESAIRDTDFAKETSSLTRAQILVQASTQTLAMANQAPQSVLSLLR